MYLGVEATSSARVLRVLRVRSTKDTVQPTVRVPVQVPVLVVLEPVTSVVLQVCVCGVPLQVL
jgi:hypothetical protein